MLRLILTYLYTAFYLGDDGCNVARSCTDVDSIGKQYWQTITSAKEEAGANSDRLMFTTWWVKLAALDISASLVGRQLGLVFNWITSSDGYLSKVEYSGRKL